MGANRRGAVVMDAVAVQAMLESRHQMTLATINRDGSIHLVAMYYGLLDGHVAFTAKSASQKIVNLLRNTHVTAMVDDGDSYEALRGVQVRGRAHVVEDEQQRRAVAISLFERRVGAFDPRVHGDQITSNLFRRTVVRIEPSHVVSWDHSRLSDTGQSQGATT